METNQVVENAVITVEKVLYTGFIPTALFEEQEQALHHWPPIYFEIGLSS